MAWADYMAINTDLSDKCKEVLKELSDVYINFEEYLKNIQRCVDAGIVPPEYLEKDLQFLHSLDSGVWEPLEMIHDYMGNIECAEASIVCIRKLVWQDKQIISILKIQ